MLYMKHGASHIQLLGTVTVGPKGQVVIPAEARERMNVGPGDKLVALYVSEKNTVCFTTHEELQSLINRMGAHVEGLRKILDEEK